MGSRRFGTPSRVRDALHIAVIARRDVSMVMSFDSGFDDIAGIVRVAA